MMPKRIFLIIILIIKKGENVNTASFDDVEKNSLENDCHHHKVLVMSKNNQTRLLSRLLRQPFKG